MVIFRKGRRHILDLNNWKRRFLKLAHLWMGGSNKREMEAYTSLEPGGRQWSHTRPLEQDRQPELAGTLPRSQLLLYWRRTEKTPRKVEEIVPISWHEIRGNNICSGRSPVLSATDVCLTPFSAWSSAPERFGRTQPIPLFLFILRLLHKGMTGFLSGCDVIQTWMLRLITEPSTACWREQSIQRDAPSDHPPRHAFVELGNAISLKDFLLWEFLTCACLAYSSILQTTNFFNFCTGDFKGYFKICILWSTTCTSRFREIAPVSWKKSRQNVLILYLFIVFVLNACINL